MVATTRAHALGAGRTGSQEHHPFGALRGRPILQTTLLQGKSSRKDLISGGGSKRSQRTPALAGQWAEAPCRPACNAPAPGVPPSGRLSPPKERQRRSRKRHCSLSRTAFERTVPAIVFFLEIWGQKKHSNIRLNPGCPHIARVLEMPVLPDGPPKQLRTRTRVFRKPGDTMFSRLIHWFAPAA